MQPLYEVFDSAKAGGFIRFDKPAPAHVADNLAERIELRPYQIEALNRYLYYLDGYQNKVTNNMNLLFNMATGSGKTVIMAALILDLYKRGYRKFVFFVNRKTIVQKTIENFTNPASSKYLFSQTISVDGHIPSISPVETLSSNDTADIQILFTTIQGLHNDLFTPREGRITLEDLVEEKIVLLSDEAHHINAWTTSEQLTGEEAEAKHTWEQGVQKIFKQNPDNVLLEFTATLGNDIRIKEKYNDVLLYKYDLKQFKEDGYSKDIVLYNVSDDIRARMLHAVLISQYRMLIAEKHGLLLKPVILFKSKRIADSEANEKLFMELIARLLPEEIAAVLDSHETLQKLSFYLHENNVSLEHFVSELKLEFSNARIRNVNNEDQVDSLQLDINHLEDADNEIRVIFAVDKLNEGWDVLNLFDIVRLYETRDGSYNRGGEYVPGKTTTQEAQLIGRGARYWPFIYETNAPDKRKFDQHIDNELRILEELYYHSLRDTDYLVEIRTALVQSGMMDQEPPKVIELRFKEAFKAQSLYKSGLVYANELLDNPHADKKIAQDYLNATGQLSVELPTQSVDITNVFDMSSSVAHDDSAGIKVFSLGDIPPHIIEKALDRRFKFYSFENLCSYLPNLHSKSEFLEQISSISVKVSGNIEELFSPSPKTWLRIADASFAQIASVIQTTDAPKIGSKHFKPRAFKDVFKEKKVLVEKAQGSKGKAMGEEAEAYYLDLKNREWYAYQEDYGDSYEKLLVKLLDRSIDALKEKWDELYLVRNERDLKLYDFDSDATFMPDYLLFLQREGQEPVTYYAFMEPKGENIEAADKWKEVFLQRLEDTAEPLDELGIQVEGIKIVGLQFYQPARESEFAEEFEQKLVDQTPPL